MSIAILAAQTGQGHISVMKALEEELKHQGYTDIDCYPDFYEQMMPSNRLLSGFYNFLFCNSPQLCNQYCEYTSLTKSDMSEVFFIGVKDFLIDFFTRNKYDIIISVSHSINYSIIRIMNEIGVRDKTKFYIVITDPFAPIAVGYAVPGADKYFCANESVKQLLLRTQIDEKNIVTMNYPIQNKFEKQHKRLKSYEDFIVNKKTILINSGSNGTNYYFDILQKLIYHDFQIIFIAGKNKLLFNKCNQFIQKNQLSYKCKIYEYVDNIEDIISNVDIVITKAGANTFFELLQMNTPMLIDSTQGTVYQEKGIKNYIEEQKIGMVFYDLSEVEEILENMLEYKNYTKYFLNIQNLNYKNGSREIIDNITKGV